jgi:3-oxoacyl-[acyl-carrier protein] reductase
MDLKLKGKRALVTGSSSGLGKAIAKMLAHEGAAVVIHGRDEARASAVAREIRDQGGRASVVLGDLSCDAGADAVASGALKDGQVDVLVNNAGAYHHLGWMETDAKVWTETYQVNVISAVRLIQQLVPLMKKINGAA